MIESPLQTHPALRIFPGAERCRSAGRSACQQAPAPRHRRSSRTIERIDHLDPGSGNTLDISRCDNGISRPGNSGDLPVRDAHRSPLAFAFRDEFTVDVSGIGIEDPCPAALTLEEAIRLTLVHLTPCSDGEAGDPIPDLCSGDRGQVERFEVLLNEPLLSGLVNHRSHEDARPHQRIQYGSF